MDEYQGFWSDWFISRSFGNGSECADWSGEGCGEEGQFWGDGDGCGVWDGTPSGNGFGEDPSDHIEG